MKKYFTLICTALMTVALLVGCAENNTGPASPSNKSANLEKIIITQPVQDAYWSPFYLAKTLGYYEAEGLDVEFQTISNGDPGAPVFAGEAQFGLRGVEMPMAALVQGQGSKILASSTSKYPYTFMGAGKEYSTVESLRGTTVAGTSPSGSPTAWVKACLAYGGLEIGTDVEMTMLPGTSATSGLINGEVSATYGGNAWLIKQMEDNGAVTIINGKDSKVFNDIMGSETYEMYMIFASDEYIASNPETVQKMLNAIAKALDYSQTQPAEVIAEALYPLFPDREDEVLYCLNDIKKYDLFNATGKHTESGYAAALKLAKTIGLITEDIPAETIYDESFLDTAWKNLNK